jgi:hypothetical protein
MGVYLKKFPVTSILGWSVSRYDVFTTCKRKYYYSYYAKHDQEIEPAKIQRLKNLTTTALEIGNIAHDVIRDLLKRLQVSSAPIDQARLKDYTLKMADDYCSSKEFMEKYYSQTDSISSEEIGLIAYQSVVNLLNSERYEWLNSIPLEKRTGWIIEPYGFGETRINELKAYCKVDFLLPLGDKAYILDWKTGKKDEQKHKKQLIGYSMFAHHNLGFSPENISSYIAYIKDQYEELTPSISSNEITTFIDTVKQESEEMYKFNADIQKNIPLTKEYFEKVDNGLCRYCEYRELCDY